MNQIHAWRNSAETGPGKKQRSEEVVGYEEQEIKKYIKNSINKGSKDIILMRNKEHTSNINNNNQK